VTEEGLARVVEEVRAAGRVGIDTEFHGERVYHPRLFLVQLAFADRVVAVDPLAVEDLEPLAKVLAEPTVETVLHAGEMDLAIFWRRYGVVPARVFDTQVAAAFVGLPYPASLAKLVQSVLNVGLAKRQTLSDWSRRPLSEDQVSYALEDVRYLLALRDHLLDGLDERGRRGWFEVEMAERSAPSRFEVDREKLYRRIGGWGRLGARGRAILRELARYREDAASRLDRPVQQVLDDRLLLDLARAMPRKLTELEENRRVHKGIVRRHGDSILACVQAGLEAKQDLAPRAPSPPPSAQEAALSDLLRAVLKVVCRTEGVATEMVAPRSFLSQLVRAAPSNEEEARALLGGWRAELLGAPLAGFLTGRKALALDPKTRGVRFLDRRCSGASGADEAEPGPEEPENRGAEKDSAADV
jgi:ribonuclease D